MSVIVKRAELINPPTAASESEYQISALPSDTVKSTGNNPPTVVAVVSIIGLTLENAPSIKIDRISLPGVESKLNLSTIIIALLTTIPHRRITPMYDEESNTLSVQ